MNETVIAIQTTQAIILAIFGVVITMYLFISIFNFVISQRRLRKYIHYAKKYDDVQVVTSNAKGIPLIIKVKDNTFKISFLRTAREDF